jgi:Tol biopolymer transport system component
VVTRVLVAAVLLAGHAAAAAAGTLTRVSVAPGGGEANGPSTVAAISADGRIAGFTSEASNLVADDRNAVSDVFVHELSMGTTERISVGAGGAEANGPSAGIALSADGALAVFASVASNLVPGDTNGVADVFVRDRARGTTERVSLAAGGAQADGSSFGALAISADGDVVAFRSFATNLAEGDTNGVTDVFVRDRGRGVTERVSVGAKGQGDGLSFWPALSADGRVVAFASAAENLIALDANRVIDVFVRDRTAGTTERASVGAGGVQGTAPSIGFPALSADGRLVVFGSNARELMPGDADTNGTSDIIVRDRTADTTERASLGPGGAEANGGSLEGAISADGRFVVFYSAAATLAEGDANGDGFDVFLRDRTSASTARLTAGSAPSFVTGAAISADGGAVALFGAAPDLVTGDANGVSDVFVWRR